MHTYSHVNMIARSPEDPGTDTNSNYNNGALTMAGDQGYHLGSSHPGTLNTLIGDGSVRGVAKTTEPDLIWRLTYVNDGVSVPLP